MNKENKTTNNLNPTTHDKLLGVVKCLFQKHKLTEGEIQAIDLDTAKDVNTRNICLCLDGTRLKEQKLYKTI